MILKRRVSYIVLFLTLNVILLPFFDNISGALFKLKLIGDGSIGSPSQIGRLLSFVMVCFLIKRFASHSIRTLALFSCLYVVLIELCIALFHFEFRAFLFGIVYSLKVLFTFFCSLYLLDLVTRKPHYRDVLIKWMVRYGTLIALLVVLAYASGFHIGNYSRGIATRGLFISGNGLGVVMGSCALLLVNNLTRFNIVTFIHIVFLLAATALIGTKASLLFVVLALGYLSLKMIRLAPIWTLCFSVFIAYFLFVPIYDVIILVFENIIFKYNNIDDKMLLLSSSRDQFITNAFESVQWSDFYAVRFLFGAGAFYAYTDFLSGAVSIRKYLENDLFELFFMYGIFSVICYFLLYVSACVLGLRYKNYFFVFLLSLVFFHSITVGHVVFNGTSALILAFCIALAGAKQTNINKS